MQGIYPLKTRKCANLEEYLRGSPVNHRETKLAGNLTQEFTSERNSDSDKIGVENTEISYGPEIRYREGREALQMSRTVAFKRDKSEGNTEIADLEGYFERKRLRKKSNLRDGKAVRLSLR